MTKIRKLTPEHEERITQCIAKVAKLVQSGADPSDAVCKVASAAGLPPGHVRLMVTSYNTGRTLSQIRRGSSLREKAATIPLADIDIVLDRLYPKTVKSAQVRYVETAVSDEYDRDPAAVLSQPQAMTKAAFDTTLPPHESKYGRAAERERLRKRAAVKRAAEQAEAAAIRAGYDVVAALEKLATYFRSYDATSFAEVRENVGIVRGDAAVKVLDHVAKEHPVVKQASVSRPVDWSSAPYSLVDACLEAVANYQKRHADYLAKSAAHREAEQEMLEKHSGLSPYRPRGGSIYKEASIDLKSVVLGGVVRDATKSLTNKLWQSDRDNEANKLLADIETPEHEDKLRSIRVNTVLHELMATDPVIHNHDPAKVATAFNYISELAPLASSQRSVMQTMLRKYLEQDGQLDLFDQEQLLKLESTLRSQRLATPMAPMPVGPPTLRTALSRPIEPREGQPHIISGAKQP